MRPLLLLVALTLAFASCSPVQQSACDLVSTRDISFTGGTEPETVTARTFGQSCDRAIAFYSIHTDDGHPIWAWTAPLPVAFGDIFAEFDPAEMRGFLERWTQPALSTTGAAPEWTMLAAGQSTLDQLTYDDIRARNLPMLCHLSGTARETCVFWEPAAGGAGHLYDRDAEVEEPT